ncbi:hypothetical protein ACFV99_16805 [Streptomyces sp. NPDC059944]|uniref:hypothetical protein n=1 Tax=unclassified Streptomyces TaxID=2593676 RepID=UPI00364D0830
MAGDVADRDGQLVGAGGVFATLVCGGQQVGVVPVASDEIGVRRRPVQSGEFQSVQVGQVGEHGLLHLPGRVDAVVDEQRALHGPGGVPGDRGKDGLLHKVDLVRDVPPQPVSTPSTQRVHIMQCRKRSASEYGVARFGDVAVADRATRG